jgi:CheY-like chemotaxis protein
MDALLTGWGYLAIVVGSRKEAVKELSRRGLSPDIIICDYRLGGDENGIEVVRLLQGQLGTRVPAVLITGDTAQDRLIEARNSGLNRRICEHRATTMLAWAFSSTSPGLIYSAADFHAGRLCLVVFCGHRCRHLAFLNGAGYSARLIAVAAGGMMLAIA